MKRRSGSASLHLTIAVESERVSTLEGLRMVAEFENRGKKPLSVVTDATPLSHGRYVLEYTDDQGRPVHANTFGMCGMMAPLQEHEIALVEAGTSFRTPVHTGRGSLNPGPYRVRLRYEAHDSDRGEDGRAPIVVERLKHFWTGILHSNWVSLVVVK